MKKYFLGLALLIVLPVCASCRPSTAEVNDPPAFVEMYLDEEDAIEPDARKRSRIINEPQAEITSYDESIYSEADFDVIVVTNGANYDLLYSVEVEDSLLGTCVYTNQSVLYHATSTIVAESDDTYNTFVSLTVPGSTEHMTYLSDRTISLTKILFSRDTVDGTFPADIPSNTQTILNFEVHAVNYFDDDLGFPVVMENGLIEIKLKPGTPEHDAALAEAKTAITIPNTINGYPIGGIYLEDLTWVEELTIVGASDNVFLLGSFPLLINLLIAGLNFEPPALSPYNRHLTINGNFTSLASIDIENCFGYHFFMASNNVIDDDEYDAYRTGAGEDLYAFPELVWVSFDQSYFIHTQIGADTYEKPFPKFETFTCISTTLDYLYFGNEHNDFPKLNRMIVSGSAMSNVNIDGNKDPLEAPVSLQFVSGEYGNFTIKGSLIGSIDFSDTTLDSLTIYGGTSNPSVLSSLSLWSTSFNPSSYNSLTIRGDHPELESIDFMGFMNGAIIIGLVEDVFAKLRSIAISGVTASHIYIGDRETAFPALETVVLGHVTLTSNFRIGFEGSLYPALEEIWISNSSINNVEIGRTGDTFAGLRLLYLENVILGGDLKLSYITCPDLETIVLIDVSAVNINIRPVDLDYVIYIDNIVLVNNPQIGDGCTKIYLVETDVTTWAYYVAVTALGIPMETGVYVP